MVVLLTTIIQYQFFSFSLLNFNSCTQFFIVINVYTESTMFNAVNPSHVHLLAPDGRELLHYKIDASIKAPCLVFAKVFRGPVEGGWLFNSVGVGCQGRVRFS